MEEGYYPDYAIQELEKVNKRLEQEYQIVWGVLSPSVERDTVMYHLFAAKKQINAILEVTKNG